MTRPRRTRARGPAFSLVEVLVAVLVLALGLLGLGAVFPTVLRQQRIATQTTMGISAQNTIAPILASNANFGEGGNGWAQFRYYVRDNQATKGDWVAIEPIGDSDFDRLGGYDLHNDPDPLRPPVFLPLSQRLFPTPFSSDAEPRFVWDLAARLTGDPASLDYPEDSPLLVAAFLRPVDTGIKTMINPDDPQARRFSLAESLIDPGLPRKARRGPVAVNKQGVPTYNGEVSLNNRYSTPVVLNVTGSGVPQSPLDQFVVKTDYFYGVQDEHVADTVLSAPGQRFLDRAGRLYTITRVERVSDRAIFTVDPPFPDTDASDDFSNADEDAVNPVIFVPQPTPIEPYVFTVNP